MKTSKLLISLIILFLGNLNVSESQYLDPNNITSVPIPEYLQSTSGQIYFDLSEININPPIFLDIAAVSNITVRISEYETEYYKYGTFNINSGNGSFGYFNIYYNDNTVDLNDLTFIQLRPNQYRDVVIIMENELRIHRNDNGSINNNYAQSINLGGIGYNLDTGRFDIADNYTDLVVQVNNNLLKFYRNNYDNSGTLYDQPIYDFELQNIVGVKIAEINEKYPPHLPFDAMNREDVVSIHSDGYIRIYINNNTNELIHFQDLNTNLHPIWDFEVDDFDEDGYNDIVVTGKYGSNKYAFIYKNISGSFFHGPIIEFNSLFWDIGEAAKVNVTDFNKDGWNDLIFVSDVGTHYAVNLFINQKTSPLFIIDAPVQYFDLPPEFDIPVSVITTDLYNKGGIALIASYNAPLFSNSGYGIKVVNAVNRNTIPPPPIVVGTLIEYEPNRYHPKLLMSYRDERDFYRYDIWKQSPTYSFQHLDFTSQNEYVDLTECVELGGSQPFFNCYYVVKTQDLSVPEPQESAFSKPVHYWVGCDVPGCFGCEGDNLIFYNNHNNPQTYKLNIFPNPFNSKTKITLSLPKSTIAKLIIYDILGRRVKELLNEYKTKGNYSVELSAEDLPSGIYLCRFETLDYSKSYKILLLK